MAGPAGDDFQLAAESGPALKSILCPIGFSEFSAKVYDYAQSLAAHYRAKLWVQHVLYSHPAFYTDDAYRESCRKLREDTLRKLKQFVKRQTRTKVQPQCVVEEGIASDGILSFAKAQKVNLIVMGTHGLRGVDRLMLGTITERVLRKSPCPVFLVRKPSHDFVIPGTKEDPVRLKKIFLGMDFSDHAHHALKYALSFAREYNAELTLLHVSEHRPSSDELQRDNAEAMRELEQSYPRGAHKSSLVKFVLRSGKPFQQIIEFATEAQTDLVVMGVRGHGSLDSALFGSTAYRVIQLGPCPVLAVHM
jgi:nucleotide-binding universal stress UspA family protein